MIGRDREHKRNSKVGNSYTVDTFDGRDSSGICVVAGALGRAELCRVHWQMVVCAC